MGVVVGPRDLSEIEVLQVWPRSIDTACMYIMYGYMSFIPSRDGDLAYRRPHCSLEYVCFTVTSL
jgi:hypothetical protein